MDDNYKIATLYEKVLLYLERYKDSKEGTIGYYVLLRIYEILHKYREREL